MRNRWWFAGSVGGAIGSLIGYALASPRAQLIGRTMWHGPRSRREIALTFDNGPSPEGTGQILDLLAREDVRATFFMLGASVEKHPDLARAVVEAGHLVGNHGYTHRNLMWARSQATANQLDRGYRAIESTCGVGPRLYRPAFGARSFSMPGLLRKRGWRMVHWTSSAGDWRLNSARNLTSWVPAVRNGDILLWHDGVRRQAMSPRTVTIAALSQVIPFLRNRGFEFVTVEDMLNPS